MLLGLGIYFRGGIWPYNLFQGCYLALEFISGMLLGLGIYFRGAIWPWNSFQGCYLALEFMSHRPVFKGSGLSWQFLEYNLNISSP